MTHVAIEQRRAELELRVRLAEQLQPDLPQAEEVEVIDQEGREKHQRPSERKQHAQDDSSDWVFNGPDDTAQRLPLPEQKDKSDTRKQNVSGTLEWLRHHARPPLLEPRARHHAMLHGEERQ